ncbi:peptidylprolyl isomerase [Pseudoflavonifractor sp. MSJ-37]|uniref:peptidylprolyl isomerase n=1 Tax=Pseudoflavonifractor sp. MSJ-37 TaxID=2841531 RepID=UPI001C110A22|nr:peptidylprolyl isomerase [Pseudoflavonifractor sp. MSJ-37]MBU5434485.1 peptidylprolyl isomerase [Pseudoflavonifractor sp. MSJ-37]
MSASRERKQRQSIPEQGLTQKQIKERREAAIKKRNTIAYTVIGVVAAILVAVLLIWNSGFFQSRTTALTINGRNYTPGEVSYYYGQAKQSNYYLSMMGYDSKTPDREQNFGGDESKTYYDYFMDTAKQNMIQTAALVDAAKEAGETLNDESKQQVENALASYDSGAVQSGYPNTASFLKAYFGQYMTKGVLRSCLEDSALANQYYNEHSDSLTYDESKLEEYYKENAADLDTYVYNAIFFDGTAESTEDADGNSVDPTDEEKEAAMSAAKDKADAFQAQAESSDFQTAADAAKAGDESLTYDGETTNVGSSVSSAYKEWLSDASRKAGDVTVIESDGSGYYVVQFLERARREDDFGTADIRHILVKAETSDEDETDSSGNKTPSDAEMDAAKEKAQSLLDQFNAGDKTAESFGELAKENSDDPGSKDEGGLYADVTRSSGFFQDFEDWIFADGRKAGDTGLVENTQSGQQGWHVMYLESTGEVLWKYTAASALRSADMQTWVEGLEDGYEAVEGSGTQYLGN